MALSQKEINDYLVHVLKHKISLTDFEHWLYQHEDELERVWGEKAYLNLISIPFRKSIALSEILKQIAPLANLGAYEDARIRDLLKQLIIDENSFVRVCKEIYEAYCDGYSFLRYMALTYISYDYDNQLQDSSNALEFYKRRDTFVREATRIVSFLQNGQLVIVDEYEYMDARDQKNQIEQYDLDKMH